MWTRRSVKSPRIEFTQTCCKKSVDHMPSLLTFYGFSNLWWSLQLITIKSMKCCKSETWEEKQTNLSSFSFSKRAGKAEFQKLTSETQTDDSLVFLYLSFLSMKSPRLKRKLVSLRWNSVSSSACVSSWLFNVFHLPTSRVTSRFHGRLVRVFLHVA